MDSELTRIIAAERRAKKAAIEECAQAAQSCAGKIFGYTTEIAEEVAAVILALCDD